MQVFNVSAGICNGPAQKLTQLNFKSTHCMGLLVLCFKLFHMNFSYKAGILSYMIYMSYMINYHKWSKILNTSGLPKKAYNKGKPRSDYF